MSIDAIMYALSSGIFLVARCSCDRATTLAATWTRERSSCSGGDQTGQELLEAALRVLQPDVVGSSFPSRASTCRSRVGARPATASSTRRRARSCARPRAEGRHDHPGGDRRRRLAQPDPARGDRRQGDRPHRPAHPRGPACRRRSRADLGRADGGRRCLRREGVARGLRRRRRSPSARSASSAGSAARSPSSPSARRSGPAQRCSGGRSTPSAPSTRGC